MSRAPVAQRDAAGCGIACIAFVLQRSYEEAIALLPINSEYARTNGLFCKDIVDAFSRAGLKATYCYLKQKRRIYADGTIVFVGRSKEFPIGHYLCRWKGKWMDSWINYPSMSPVRAGWRKKLPERPIYAIYPFP